MEKNAVDSSPKISNIEVTNENLTSRSGLQLFVKYLKKVKILPLVVLFFSFFRKNPKGAKIEDIFLQFICFFVDGTYKKIKGFDQLKKDEGYATTIETSLEDMCSESVIRRFLNKFNNTLLLLFKKIMIELFIWRLKIKSEKVITLFVDTFVLNNNDCKKREGVKHTYKGCNGFQPFNIIWNGFIILSVLKPGNRHSLSEDTAKNELVNIIKIIRKRYSEDVQIIIKFDAGFFDNSLYETLHKLNVFFIGAGKLTSSVKDIIEDMKDSMSKDIYLNEENTYEFFECGLKYSTWNRMYRAIYIERLTDDKQHKLEFARDKNIIITNLKELNKDDKNYIPELEEYCKAEVIIKLNHSRGADELAHRGIKDFGTEQLPFIKFEKNAAFYYIMCISYFLFLSFHEDVISDIIPIGSYATTVRRKVFDIAGKIVKKSRILILKITQTAYDFLNIKVTFEKINHVKKIEALL